jgi:putative FmdB family regulatory protein
MPVYDYLCSDCGPFTDMRPMSECDEPGDCSKCTNPSPRAILRAPNFLCMPTDRRKAIAVNERRSNGPKTLDQYKASHGPCCGCCSGRPSRLVRKPKAARKAFRQPAHG